MYYVMFLYLNYYTHAFVFDINPFYINVFKFQLSKPEKQFVCSSLLLLAKTAQIKILNLYDFRGTDVQS